MHSLQSHRISFSFHSRTDYIGIKSADLSGRKKTRGVPRTQTNHCVNCIGKILYTRWIGSHCLAA